MSGQYSLGTGEQSLLRMLGISPSSVTVNARTAMGISTFYACVRVKSEMLASLPFGVYRKLEGGGSQSLSDHPLSEILRTRANPSMGDFVARRMMLVNYCVYGAAVARIDRSPQGDTTAITPFPTSEITVYYDSVTDSRYFTLKDNPKRVMREDEVIYLKDLGFDGTKGTSVLEFQETPLKTDLFARKFLGDYYQKGTFAGGFITTPDDGMTQEKAERYKSAIVSSLQGSSGDGYGLAVLGPGVDYKQVTRTPVESQMNETFSQSDTAISMIMGVPLVLLGNTTKATSFGTGFEQIAKMFAQTTLLPLARQIEQEYDYKCFTRKELGSGHYTKHNFRALLKADAASQGQFLAQMIQNGVYTQNEVRAWDELSPVDAGDTNWIQGNMISLANAAVAVPKSNNLTPSPKTNGNRNQSASGIGLNGRVADN